MRGECRTLPRACRVKLYEGKLAALNAINSALQKENGQLRKQLARAEMPETDAGERLLALDGGTRILALVQQRISSWFRRRRLISPPARGWQQLPAARLLASPAQASPLPGAPP